MLNSFDSFCACKTCRLPQRQMILCQPLSKQTDFLLAVCVDSKEMERNLYLSKTHLISFAASLRPLAITMLTKRPKTRLESTGTSPGIWTLVYGLWTEDDLGLPTGPLTIKKTL